MGRPRLYFTDAEKKAAKRRDRDRYYQKNKSKRRNQRYGLADDEYEAMWEAQGRSCALCGATSGKFVVDHDHRCCPSSDKTCGQCVRGILCHACNIQLSLLERVSVWTVLRYLSGR